MVVELELGASSLKLDGERLVVNIPAGLFTPRQWLRLMEMVARAEEHPEWLRIPFQVAQQSGARLLSVSNQAWVRYLRLSSLLR